jgi:predicted phage terminase large subunit-like protein
VLYQKLPAVPDFASWAQGTFSSRFHDWQRNILAPLCNRFAWKQGVRVMMHAPPQVGKSLLVSQRLPAYILGLDPERHRVGLICFNIDRSEEFATIARDLMLEREFVETFGIEAAIPRNASAKEFYTAGRKGVRDAQPSFAAYGLRTGVIGRGFTHVIIDDPYPSVADALSPAYNKMVWQFMSQGLEPRITPETNILGMYHRYQPNDVAGKAIASGEYEYIRLPAEMDENEDGSDPTGRKIGQLLSPRLDRAKLAKTLERDPFLYFGQFQGKPIAQGGEKIQRHWLQEIDASELPKIELWVRYWDLTSAKSKHTNDYFAGALIGIGPQQEIYLRDMAWFRAQWAEAESLIAETTKRDRELCKQLGARYWVGVEDVFWQSAMIQDLYRHRSFKGVQLQPVKPEGDKLQRANGWILRARYGGFYMVRGAWDMEGCVNELAVFDGLGLAHDDQADAISGAYKLQWALMGGAPEEEEPPKVDTNAYYERLAELHRTGSAGIDIDEWGGGFNS